MECPLKTVLDGVRHSQTEANRGAIIYSYTHSFKILFHYGLSQDSEYRSLRYTIGPCCLSHFIRNSLHLLIPNSQSISPPHLHTNSNHFTVLSLGEGEGSSNRKGRDGQETHGNYWWAPSNELQGRCLRARGLFGGCSCFCDSGEVTSQSLPRAPCHSEWGQNKAVTTMFVFTTGPQGSAEMKHSLQIREQMVGTIHDSIHAGQSKRFFLPTKLIEMKYSDNTGKVGENWPLME